MRKMLAVMVVMLLGQAAQAQMYLYDHTRSDGVEVHRYHPPAQLYTDEIINRMMWDPQARQAYAKSDGETYPWSRPDGSIEWITEAEKERRQSLMERGHSNEQVFPPSGGSPDAAAAGMGVEPQYEEIAWQLYVELCRQYGQGDGDLAFALVLGTATNVELVTGRPLGQAELEQLLAQSRPAIAQQLAGLQPAQIQAVHREFAVRIFLPAVLVYVGTQRNDPQMVQRGKNLASELITSLG